MLHFTPIIGPYHLQQDIFWMSQYEPNRLPIDILRTKRDTQWMSIISIEYMHWISLCFLGIYVLSVICIIRALVTTNQSSIGILSDTFQQHCYNIMSWCRDILPIVLIYFVMGDSIVINLFDENANPWFPTRNPWKINAT